LKETFWRKLGRKTKIRKEKKDLLKKLKRELEG